MKKHNALKVVIITLLVFILLSWLLPAAMYQTTYQEIGRSQVGIFDLFSYNYLSTVLSYFGYVAAFVLVVGGFYGVLIKTGAYRRMLDAICKKFKGKEAICLAIIMLLFAVATSFCGVQLALLMFFPFVISLVLMMGYNKLAATAVTAGSVAVGLMGTTFAYSTIQVLAQYLSVTVTSEIWTKLIILVIGLVLLIFYVVKFGKKAGTKEDADKNDYIPEPVKGNKKKRVWPLVVILDVIFVVMILGFISWYGAFNLTTFDDATTAVTEFAIADFPIFGKILGVGLPSFGNWSLFELITVMIVAIIVMKFVYGIKWDEVIEGFGAGVKKALLPAAIILLIYTCLVLTTYNSYQLFLYKAILSLSKGFNIFTTGLVIIVSSIFSGDALYAFYNVIPYFMSVVKDTSVYPLVAVIFQSLFGLATLVLPTSVPLMVTLAYLKVPYQKWLKYIWKILVTLLVILFIIFTIVFMI